VYPVNLLREDFSLLVTHITQGKAIDVIAFAMVLLDTGSGDSRKQKKS
jgi:hypothetical protein